MSQTEGDLECEQWTQLGQVIGPGSKVTQLNYNSVRSMKKELLRIADGRTTGVSSGFIGRSRRSEKGG